MRSVQKRAVRLPEGRRKVCVVHRRRGERKEDGGRKSVLGFLSAPLPQLFAPFPAGLAKMPGQLGMGIWPLKVIAPSKASTSLLQSIQRRSSGGSPVAADFLIDSGADRTVFSAALLARLRLPAKSTQPGFTLSGIGGTSEFVLVTTVMEFTRDDGGPVRVRGEFAGFTDPIAIDLSILGHDVLNNFDLIISRRRNEILLLAPRHQCRIEGD